MKWYRNNELYLFDQPVEASNTRMDMVQKVKVNKKLKTLK